RSRPCGTAAPAQEPCDVPIVGLWVPVVIAAPPRNVIAPATAATVKHAPKPATIAAIHQIDRCILLSPPSCHRPAATANSPNENRCSQAAPDDEAGSRCPGDIRSTASRGQGTRTTLFAVHAEGRFAPLVKSRGCEREGDGRGPTPGRLRHRPWFPLSPR